MNGLGDPDLSRIIPKAAAVALGKEAEVVVNGDGTAIRDFVHVADVARRPHGRRYASRAGTTSST